MEVKHNIFFNITSHYEHSLANLLNYRLVSSSDSDVSSCLISSGNRSSILGVGREFDAGVKMSPERRVGMFSVSSAFNDSGTYKKIKVQIHSKIIFYSNYVVAMVYILIYIFIFPLKYYCFLL